MGQLKYKATIYDKEWLSNNSFTYSRAFSDPDNLVFIRRIPVYRWGLITTLEAEFRLYTKDGTVTVDVYDGSGLTRGIYAPFYYETEETHNDFLDVILKNIDRECTDFGFVKE